MKLPCIVVFIITFASQNDADRACQTPYDCPGASECHLFTHHWACVSSHHRLECHCHTGNKPVISKDSKYTMYIDEETFSRAEAICKSKGQRLVKIDDVSTYNDLMNFAFRSLQDAYPRREIVDGVWIGLKLDASQSPGIVYRHLDGTQATFFMWETANHEPNLIDTDQCVRLDVDHFLMRTTNCNSRHPYICEHVTPGPSTPPQGGERCVAKSDCAAHCRTTEYHCFEYSCMCGTLTFGNTQ